MSDASRGGIHIGNVGGNVSFTAGGDVVGGDKAVTISNGFNHEDNKRQFMSSIEELRTTLRAVQAKINEAVGVSQDDKDEIAAEVIQQVLKLKAAKDEATSLPVAQPAPPDKGKRIADYLQSTETLLNKVSELGSRAAEIGAAVKPYIEKALPLLMSARLLFGLP